MKKQLTILGVSAIIITGAAFTAYAQKKDKGNQKEQKHKEHPGRNGKGNGRQKNDVEFRGNSNKNHGKLKIKPGKPNKDEGFVNGSNGKGNKPFNKNANERWVEKSNGPRNNKHLRHVASFYSWNESNFKQRKNLRKQDKVTICHKFNGNNEPAVAIRVSRNALQAHLNHGDVLGGCPGIPNTNYSDVFLKRRINYYNTIEDSYEQVSYSQSILDYALARLTNSRQQLLVLQNNNMPIEDIRRKQATVYELEENVSLLETLLGVAAELVVNKL